MAGERSGTADSVPCGPVSKVSFRAGVVAVISRSDGQVLAFERADVPGAWQLPQGGLDEGETAEQAAWREMAEETGLTRAQVELVAEGPEWIAYELPADARTPKTGLGQVQRWFHFRVVDDAIEPTVDGDEFVAWKWVDTTWLIDNVVAWRRQSYRQGLRR